MQLVYATGQTQEREFQIASTREAVPTGARVFATCTGERAVEHIGEITFQNMTDGEFYNLREMVREARRRAAEPPPPRQTPPDESTVPAWTVSLRRLLHTMFNR